MMNGKIVRLWWPLPLLSRSDLLLFGWFFGSDSRSLDVVVAAGIPSWEASSSLRQSNLQEVLHCVNGELPNSLLNCSKLSVIGYLSANIISNDANDLREDSTNSKLTSCGCHELAGILGQQRWYFVENGTWIYLTFSTDCSKKEIGTPKLHHMHENGKANSLYHLHVILYDPPKFGSHHFSLNCWSFATQEFGTYFQVPDWYSKLQPRHSPLDVERIVLSINCSNAAEEHLTGHLKTCTPLSSVRIKSMFISLFWQFLSTCAASTSTLIYINLQICHKFLSIRSRPLLCTLIKNVFRHAWLNVNIRSCEFLYWPVILLGSGSRSNSNVEYMHKVELRKHNVWSNIVSDIFLGTVMGVLLLVHVDTISYEVVAFSGQVTNHLLRSGCVWLMGVPAGFKLNTELAEFLGMASLNAIQIWSTLWFFMGSALRYAIIAIALSGIFLGLTVLSALCMDMLRLVTFHILVLHWLISFIYSQQIMALASLWRLFRGRKWNPLRQRFDSIDYTVEEHVVGSLLFTPLLLLLPTTSVFYVFFTIVNSFISFCCFFIDVMISLLHAIPNTEVLLWMLRKGRFPSGIWFEIVPTSASKISGCAVSHNDYPSLDLNSFNKYTGETTLVSILHSNYATIGQVLMPKFRKVFSGVSPSSGFSSIYGMLSGQRIPSSLQARMPPTMPWMSLSFRDYWRLCRNSILDSGL